jgi:two-component sensor histidine kinase
MVRGFIYAPFRIDDLVESALEYASWLPVQLEIHDGGSDEGPLLFRSKDADNLFGDRYVVSRSVDIAGRQWSFLIWPSQKFKRGNETGIALLLGAISLLMAAAIAASMRSQFRALEASREVLRVSQAAASQKDFLLQEMKHRIKNSIARVLAIARQTANHSANVEEFTNSFTNRLQAMATSQDLLARSHGEKADLAELLEGELLQVFGDSFTGSSSSGPEHQLGVKSTQALALVFHELATNALKYANIDEPGSRIDIRWKTGAKAHALVLEWREYFAKSNPDLENGDTAGGFGTRLMRSLVENELSGKFESKMTPEGICVRIEVPKPRR